MRKNKLSNRDKDIIRTLYRYRGMTAWQLAQKVHNTYTPKNSQKSMIHNYLKRLKKQKLVTSKKLEEDVALGSIYYLTPIGFNIAKDLLNIEIGQIGDGYLFADDFESEGYHTHADLEYSIYKPPLEQIGHHLLLIDTLIKLDFLDKGNLIDYRLSMYATREYQSDKGNGKLRPDAEMLIDSNRSYFIEIDKGTEGYQQLYGKFINYKHYFSQLNEEELPDAILFITDEKRQLYGIKRRWATILTAYLNAMGPFSAKVNLIFSPINMLEDTISLEMKRPYYNKLAEESVRTYFKNEGYSSVKFFKFKSMLPFAVAIKGNKYQLIFTRLANEFESLVFGGFFLFSKKMHIIDAEIQKNKLQRLGLEQVILYHDRRPYLPSAFPKEKWTGDQQKYMEILFNHLTYLPLKNIS
ncbi:replication-relaxation family protein [Caldifermentibacillus hisashii]|uniref:replication-relaxation family protein n=1 Tax=Caldifermentibacillus hisashii TaxID=996558 RepID=UPI0031FC7A6E